MWRLGFLLLLSVGVSASTCTVKDDIKDLQKMKAECESLQPELEALGSRKFTKKIDDAIKDCKAHGFWEHKNKKIETFDGDV